MPLLRDVFVDAAGDDSDKKIDSLVKQINEQNRQISNEDRTKIIKDSSGTPRILFGEGPSQFYGMKVSQSGYDVSSATDSELIFNSSSNLFKIVASGTLDLNRLAGTASVSTQVSAPTGANAFLSWGTITNASPLLTYPLTYYAPNGTGGMLWGVRAYYDATAGAVKFFHESYNAGITSSTYNLTIKYYLLQETLT